MTVENSTTREGQNHYTKITPQRRIESAVEMASELSDQRERLCALSIALLDQLRPPEGKDAGNPIAFRLAELLEEQLGDIAQQSRLMDCLEAIKQCDIVALRYT